MVNNVNNNNNKNNNNNQIIKSITRSFIIVQALLKTM